ncbi:hypothetical protein RHODOSMS8_00012 [Rhodobiaceae bacterium]|nr:hypothetical protein RHODOSMS8_00012 [Rhodobiaceae bacterium]
MDRRNEFLILAGLFALWLVSLTVWYVATGLGPPEGWSRFASDWGSVIGGSLAAVAAVGTILAMRHQTERNIAAVRQQTVETVAATKAQSDEIRKQTSELRSLEDRRAALEHAAYLRTTASEITSITNDFVWTAVFVFRIVKKVQSDDGLRSVGRMEAKEKYGADVSEAMIDLFATNARREAFKRHLETHNDIGHIKPINVGFLPHALRAYMHRAFERFNDQADTFNKTEEAFHAVSAFAQRTLNNCAELEVKVKWSIALLEATASCIEERENVQIEQASVVEAAKQFLQDGHLYLLMPSLFEQYDLTLELTGVEESLADLFEWKSIDAGI